MPAAAVPRDTSSPTRVRSTLDLYMKDISPNDLLTQAEEAELARRIREGDRDSFVHMIESNLRFVITVAKEYQGQGLPLEDLIGEGNLGLVHAAARFDESFGVKFTTYAVWWIRQSILAALANQARLVRLPINRVKELCRLDRLIDELRQLLGREPSAEEVAAESGMTVQQVRDIMFTSRWHVSLDSPAGDADVSMIEMLEDKARPSPAQDFSGRLLTRELEQALADLPAAEAKVLRLYFGLNGDEPITLEEIGNRLGLTKERIRQIRDKALRTLKHPRRLSRIRYLAGGATAWRDVTA